LGYNQELIGYRKIVLEVGLSLGFSFTKPCFSGTETELNNHKFMKKHQTCCGTCPHGQIIKSQIEEVAKAFQENANDFTLLNSFLLS
jgi:hypothetical protein